MEKQGIVPEIISITRRALRTFVCAAAKLEPITLQTATAPRTKPFARAKGHGPTVGADEVSIASVLANGVIPSASTPAVLRASGDEVLHGFAAGVEEGGTGAHGRITPSICTGSSTKPVLCTQPILQGKLRILGLRTCANHEKMC